MARPATTQQRIAGKQRVDYLRCSWLVCYQAARGRFPQIHETVSRIDYSLN
jgi:hypothetical protein